MCTGISNVMKTDIKHVIFNDDDVKLDTEFDVDQNTTITSLTPYCQNVHLQYHKPADSTASTYWLTINTIPSFININDDTQQYMNISKYFRYPYTSLSISDNSLFLSLESFQLFFKHENFGPFDGNITNPNTLKPAYFSLYLGQSSLISFNPTIISDGIVYSILELNPRLEQLPINLESNEVQFGINFRSRTVKFEETKINTCK